MHRDVFSLCGIEALHEVILAKFAMRDGFDEGTAPVSRNVGLDDACCSDVHVQVVQDWSNFRTDSDGAWEAVKRFRDRQATGRDLEKLCFFQ